MADGPATFHTARLDQSAAGTRSTRIRPPRGRPATGARPRNATLGAKYSALQVCISSHDCPEPARAQIFESLGRPARTDAIDTNLD
jgi:hypothetical protein